MNILKIGVIAFLITSQIGCSSFGRKLKSFISGKSSTSGSSKMSSPNGGSSKGVSFSQNPNLDPGPRRQYRRMTKKNLQQTSRLDSKSGSLWVMEGQGAYLFSQNIVRMIGDTLVVRIEGEPREQLVTKVEVIGNLLKRLEKRRVASELAKKAKEEKEKKGKKNAKKTTKTAGAKNKKTGNSDLDTSDLKVKNVTTRIVERLIDGNYRIKGSQPFMIGKREYKVIVTGIIRSEDFNEDGVSATTIVDPKFDIVSVRRGRI